jgi:hypothetical protein
MSNGDFPALLVKEDLGCPSVFISGTRGHLIRRNNMPTKFISVLM